MPYKILSMDGGGSWNLLQALTLGDLYGEDTPGSQVLAGFDLAIANSGGALVLAGLMLDRTPSQMVDMILNETRTIFQPDGFHPIAGAIGLAPKFSTEKKRQGLLAALPGSDTLSMREWAAPTGPNGKPVKALVPAFDYDRERATFFRTFDSAGGPKASGCALLDVIHASSNAPVIYFDKPARIDDPDHPNQLGRRYWDGAIGGYNNPVMAGVVEALAEAKKPADIRVLAVGTGNTRLAPYDASNTAPELIAENKSQGLTTDVRLIAGSILDDPPDAANYVAFNVLGKGMARPPTPLAPIDSGSLVRMNPMLQPVWNDARQGWDPPVAYADDLATFARLAGLGLAATEDPDLRSIRALYGFWKAGAVGNQPILSDPDTYELVIGDPTYAAAKARWAGF